MIIFYISLAVVCIAIGSIATMFVFKKMMAGYLHVIPREDGDPYMYMEVTKPSVEAIIRNEYVILRVRHRGNISHE